NACSNIVPTPEELATFDLTEDEHDPPSSPTTTSVNPKIVQPNDIADFDNFSTRSPEQLLRRSSRVSDTSSPPPPKRRKKVDTPETKRVDKKFEELVILIKENYSQLVLSRHKENNKVDPQSSNKQPSSHIRTDFADAVGVSVNEGGQQVHVNAEIDHNISNEQQMKRVSELQHTYESTHVDTEANDPKKVSDNEAHQAPQALNEVNMDEDGADTVQHNIRHFTPFRIIVDSSDSSTSTTISPSTEAAIDALVSDLGKVPIHAKPLCVYNPQNLNDSHDLLSDSQLSTDIPTTEIVVRSHSKTHEPRNRMPSRIIQSPYVTSFGKPSEDKYRSKASSFEFEMMDFVVAFPINKNWFYVMSQPNKCWTDQDNNFGSLLEAQVPFMVEFAQDIMQQKSDNLECGLYVATFAEYLSDQIETSLVYFLPEYLRKRYGALLWSYGSEKAKGAYVSENDDPPKPKSVVTQPPEEDLVHIV
ncbi:hypothetical protein H5410_048505, partial [Solanum commersonii]